MRYGLEDAAQKVQISRKTLDDYLLQLRLGTKNGFSFSSNKYAMVGELRKFNRKARNQKESESSQKIDE